MSDSGTEAMDLHGMDDDSVPASVMGSGVSMGMGTGMGMGSGLTDLSSPDAETMKTVNIIRLYLKTELVGLVKTAVESAIETKLKDIRDKNARLTKENLDLTQRVSALETALDDSEQYSRRNSECRIYLKHPRKTSIKPYWASLRI